MLGEAVSRERGLNVPIEVGEDVRLEEERELGYSCGLSGIPLSC